MQDFDHLDAKIDVESEEFKAPFCPAIRKPLGC